MILPGAGLRDGACHAFIESVVPQLISGKTNTQATSNFLIRLMANTMLCALKAIGLHSLRMIEAADFIMIRTGGGGTTAIASYSGCINVSIFDRIQLAFNSPVCAGCFKR